MAGLHFEVTADNNDFLRKMQGVRSSVSSVSSGVEKESERMDTAFKRLAASVGAIFTAQQAARIIENIVRVRGEFQQLEVAFTTMLRSGEKADKLMSEAVEFAARTPFDLQGVASGIRQLLAYGTAAEDAIKEVEMLGNVAAGLSVPLNDMIYLYGTLRSQGRAYTVDIRQFAGRGVPIYEELSKILGVTVAQVNEFISAGKVGFAEVEQAFKNMTSEGGMFYNLMQEQSKTITGQISNLKDNIDMMFNEMGQNAEGFISDVLSGASYLVEHYKDVLRILGTLVAMYGSYRATLMLVAAAQKSSVALGNARMTIMKLEAVLSGQVAAQEKAMGLAREAHIAALQKELTAEEQANIVKRLRVSAIQQLLTAQQQEYLSNLNLTASSANYEAVAMSVLTVEQKEALGKTDLSAKSALYRSALEQEVLAKRQSMAATLEAMRAEVKAAAQKLASSKQSTASSRQVVAAAQAELAAATQVGNASRIVTAQKRLESAQDSLLAAKKSQLAAMSDFYAKKKILEATASRQAAVASAADTAAKEAQAAATTLVGTASSRTSRFVKSLTTAIKANPIGLAISAITGLIAAISSWVSKQREAREEIEAAVKPLQDEYRQVNELANKLKDSNLKEEERKKVLTELKELAPDVVAGIEDEADSLELLNDRLEDFNNAKLAEIAVKRFSMEGGFSETVDELDEAKGKLQQEEAGLVNIYADIYARYSENRSKVGDFWRQQMDDILNSADSVTEKVRKIYGVNDYEGLSPNSLKAGFELGRRQSDRAFILGDEQDIADYNKALDKYEKAEDEYAEHAESLSKRIRAVAESMFPEDIGERESLISKLLAAYGLGGDPGNTEPIGPQPRILPKDFDRQVEEAKAAVEEARKELSDLMQGILPENAAADFDFASAIEEAAKKLKEAEGKYSTLTGYDPKASEKAADDRAKAEEKAAAELAEVRARIEDEEYELKKSSTTDRIQLLELEKQHALEALQEELEAAKLVYEALGKDTAELEAAYAKLSELTGKQYDIEISNERDEQTENAAAELQSLLSQYQDYAAKRKAIEEQYNEDIRKLQKARTDENAAEIDAAIAEASRQMNDELFSIDRSNGEVFSKIFGSIPDMTRQQIREAITLARQELAKLDEDASPEAFKAISDALHELEDADINWDTSGWVSGFDNVAKKLNEIVVLKRRAESAEASGDTAYVEELNVKIKKSQDDLKKGLVATGVSTFVNGLQKASEYMKQIAEYSGDTRLGEMGEQIGALAQNLSAAGQGAAQGGWIGAIVGGVTDMVSQTIEAFVSARLEQEEFLANQRDFAREYAAIQRELKEEDYESIFGTREIFKASDAWKKAQETMKEYNEAVNKEMDRPKEEYDFNSLGAGIFLPGTGIGGWGWGKSLTNEYKSALEAFEKGYTELQGMQVKVKDYSGWANFWGKKDEFMSLKDLAPELWGENGVFQVDAAEAFLETNTQISDEQRKQIQNLIDMKGEYDDLIDQVDQYLASIFGNVSQEISDAIFDAVLNGADAWDSFEDTAISVIDKIGRQMVQEFVVQAYLDTFQDRLRDAVGSDNPAEDLSDIMMEIYSGLGGVLEEGTEAYSEWLEYMKEQGLDITKLYEERAGSTKGVAQASQESVDYLNGLMTNVNDNVFSLSENVKVLAGYNKMMLMVTTQIEANTRPIGNILSFLYTIYDEVHAARKAMDDQGTRGIKIR